MRCAVPALALAALLAAALAPAALAAPPAPGLLTGVSQIGEDLALLGQGSSPTGLSRRQTLPEIRFDNRDGYSFSVIGFGQTVAIGVERGHGHRRLSTTYLAHGTVTPTSIRASFADRGRIAVRFHPSGHVVRASKRAGCSVSSSSVIASLGTFVGELSFRGEGGYTSAQVSRVPGRQVNFGALIACLLGAVPKDQITLPHPQLPLDVPALVPAFELRGGAQAPSVPTHPTPGHKATTLFADDKLPLSRTAFAVQTGGSKGVRLQALDERSEGSIGVIRTATVPGPRSAFAFDDALSSASVSPAKPFSGTGAFQHGPGGAASWSGSLAVSFLGAAHVPLTGPAFTTVLTRGF